MAVRKVIQPHPRGRGWTFAQHKEHINPDTHMPYLGGDDLQRGLGQSVGSPCWADATSLGGGVIKLKPVQGGRPIYVRELGRLNGSYPRRVDTGETIAYAGKKWPHYDTTDILGRRASIMPRINAYKAYEKKLAEKEAAAKAQEKTVKLVGKYLNENGFTFKDTKAETTGKRDVTYWRGIQRSAGITATGTVGTRTKAEEKRLIKLVTTKATA